MTDAQVATIFILTGLFALGGLAAWAGAKIASRREAKRFARECIERERRKREELREWIKKPPRHKTTNKEKRHV